jgi:hypothetical protein
MLIHKQIQIWTPTPDLSDLSWAFDRAPSGPSCLAGGTLRGEGHLRSKTSILGNRDESWWIMIWVMIWVRSVEHLMWFIQDLRSKVCWWHPCVFLSEAEDFATELRGLWIAEALVCLTIWVHPRFWWNSIYASPPFPRSIFRTVQAIAIQRPLWSWK